MPISEALREHPELVRQYIGSVVPVTDNFFATLNSAVFSDGSFVYVPPGVRCPMELSTYFRINEKNTGQFERTLIIADKGSYVSYLEGCTAPMRDENQLHAAVVELVALDDAEIKYSTVQNWYPGDAEGKGGIYNFVTKRGDCRGPQLEDLLDPGRDRLGHHLEVSELHPARRQFAAASSTRSRSPTAASRSIPAPRCCTSARTRRAASSPRASRPGVRRTPIAAWSRPHRKATGARNFTNCDSLLVGDKCGAHTVPYIEAKNSSAVFEHEATTSKISEDMLFYCRQRGLVGGGGRGAGGQRLRQGRAAAAADGVRGRGAEADLDQPGRERGLTRATPWMANSGSGRKCSATARRRSPGRAGRSSPPTSSSWRRLRFCWRFAARKVSRRGPRGSSRWWSQPPS